MKNLKRYARILSAILLCAVSAMSFSSTGAIAMEKTGNGGGSWVCREKDGSIRWVKFVDLFEAQSEFGLTLKSYQGSYEDVVDQVSARLLSVSQDLYEQIRPILRDLKYLESSSHKVVYTDDTLEVIDDSLYRVKPRPADCTGGVTVPDPKSGEAMVPYEQLINYKPGGLILIQRSLWDRLNAEEKGAAVLHEAIYRFLRETQNDDNSVRARRIVGLLFSTLSTDEIASAVDAVLGEGWSGGTLNTLEGRLRRFGQGYYVASATSPDAFSCALHIIAQPKDHSLEVEWQDGARNGYACSAAGQARQLRCKVDDQLVTCVQMDNDLINPVTIQVLANNDLLVNTEVPSEAFHLGTFRMVRVDSSQLVRPTHFSAEYNIKALCDVVPGVDYSPSESVAKDSIMSNIRETATHACYAHGWSHCDFVDGPRIVNKEAPICDWQGVGTVLGRN